jgi:hypothetical protein
LTQRKKQETPALPIVPLKRGFTNYSLWDDSLIDPWELSNATQEEITRNDSIPNVLMQEDWADREVNHLLGDTDLSVGLDFQDEAYNSLKQAVESEFVEDLLDNIAEQPAAAVEDDENVFQEFLEGIAGMCPLSYYKTHNTLTIASSY